MAAPTTQQAGADFIITVGGQTLGGRRGATITLETDGLDASTADDGYWDYMEGGLRGWNIQFDNLFLEGNLKRSGKSLAFNAALAGGALAPVEAVDNVTLNLTATLEPVVNQDDAFERAYIVVAKRWEMSLGLAYIDPAGSGGTQQGVLWQAERDNATIDFEVQLSGLSFSGQAMVGRIPLSVPHRNLSRIDGLTLLPRGEIQQSGTLNVGLAGLMNAFLAVPVNPVAVVFKTSVTGATQWSGNGLLTSLNIQIPRSGMATVNGQITGTGPVTRGTTA